MATSNKNQPVTTIRDGALKATVWSNTSEKGEFYSVDFSRTYTDQEGEYQDSRSFSGSELLRLANLATMAYNHIAAMK